MKRNTHAARLDLTDWVVHFVHGRDECNLPSDEECLEQTPIPYTTDPASNERFEFWSIRDTEAPIPHDASAFEILLRIMRDGCIRSSWSFRRRKNDGNVRPTIYGTRSAVCFTEMPLYALLHYARQRANDERVSTYAIALKRDELFRAGARPAIYGLTAEHRELRTSALLPRILSPGCGISEHEQYRYVSTSFEKDSPIDWTHEREWRWCDSRDELDYPGLPVWLANGLISFSQILIVVQNEEEVESALGVLKTMKDSACDEYCYEYEQDSIKSTRVICLSEVFGKVDDTNALIRLDDIPVHQIRAYRVLQPSAEYVQEVKGVWEAAKVAAERAAAQYRDSAPRNSDGFLTDVFGFAFLETNAAQSIFVQALLCLKIADTNVRRGYGIRGITDCCQEHVLGEQEAAARAALSVFQENFPDTEFRVRTAWD